MSQRPFLTPSPARSWQRTRRAAGLAAAGLTVSALALGTIQMPANGAATTAPRVMTDNDLDDIRFLGDTPLAAEDVDVRGSVEASLTQLTAADRLGADVRWNDFGTPASILPRDGSLGPASTDPRRAPDSAKSWLRANSELFGLSASEMESLALVENQEFAQSDARAVLFRQRFGELTSAVGGAVTVGVADGEIAYVSSTLVKGTSGVAYDDSLLSPSEGWLAAAQDIGADWLGGTVPAAGAIEAVAPDDIFNEFTTLRVEGFAQEQQARVRALALADGTVRPVIEANVVNVDGDVTAAYTSLVDAETGETLWRQSQVDQFAEGGAAPRAADVPTAVSMPSLEDNPSKTSFEGELAADCATVEKHEFTITDRDTRQIVVVATAVNPANDILVKIFGPDGQLLTSGDTGTSPEVALASGDPLPKGTYAAQVCMFDGVPPLPPANYIGNVSVSSRSTPTGEQALPFPPRWRYFTANPRPNFSPDDTPKNDVVGCWVTSSDQENIRGCTEPTGPIRNPGSRAPWDVNPNTELSSYTTLGNNVIEREAWFSPLTPGGFFQAPFSPERRYTSRFDDVWNNSKCDPSNLRPGGNDIMFAVQSLFVNHNRLHDYSWSLGFTEKNYNLQQNNFGASGANGDPEIGNVQAGAATTQVFDQSGVATGRNNANQITLQDGVPGITNQYLFQPVAGAFYAPCADGGLDVGIVGHEYTHAITGRMVGGPDEGITSEQGGAMGESWSDLVAAEYQFSHGYDNGGNTWAVGLYATGNLKTAIRNYAINDNPLTYGELGYDSVGNQVHADGEIWNATMWRVRQALVNKHDRRFPYRDDNLQVRCSKGVPNLGPKQSEDCPGNRRWVQLMFDSFLLQQGATSMLDARDAFLAADRMRYGKGRDNNAVIWKAFARSGMGVGAKTADADAGDVTPSFAAPAGNGTVEFRPTLPDGGSVPGKVFIGTYEARATPVADTLPKSKLDNRIPMTPGTYPAIFQSPRTGLTRFTVKVGGGSAVVRIPVQTNLSSKANGAEVVAATEGSRNPDFLIDNTEATNWGGVNAGGENVDDKSPSVTVDLAGTGAQTIRRVVVSALLRPADVPESELPFLVGQVDEDPDSGSRFTALRKFAVEVCAAACDESGSWSRAFTSGDAGFPALRPRPVSPKLTFRSFSFAPVKASQVRFVVLENQCTGFKGYAGELDNDPTNATDCKTASDRGSIVHAAEFEVFAR